MDYYLTIIPVEALGLFYTLLLCFLIGIERESSTQNSTLKFGGVRTYPLIGLLGYSLALVDGASLLPYIFGLLSISSLLVLYYNYNLKLEGKTDLKTELSALITYLIAGFTAKGDYWLPLAITIIMTLLLHSKSYLQNLVLKIPSNEVMTFVKFLLLSLVILPVVPNKEFTPFNLNPFRIWLIIVVVNGISYVSYLLQIFLKGRGGLFFTAILGGTYSSTVTTVVLAKQSISQEKNKTYQYASSILVASSVMYLRVLILVYLFNQAIFWEMFWTFLTTSFTGIFVSLFVYRYFGYKSNFQESPTQSQKDETQENNTNPLDLVSAVIFAFLFVLVTTANHYATAFLGSSGIYTLAVAMGFMDVDPFILSIIQSNQEIVINTSVLAITLATASNNFLKGLYTLGFARNRVGIYGFLFLLGLSIYNILVYNILF